MKYSRNKPEKLTYSQIPYSNIKSDFFIIFLLVTGLSVISVVGAYCILPTEMHDSFQPIVVEKTVLQIGPKNAIVIHDEDFIEIRTYMAGFNFFPFKNALTVEKNLVQSLIKVYKETTKPFIQNSFTQKRYFEPYFNTIFSEETLKRDPIKYFNFYDKQVKSAADLFIEALPRSRTLTDYLKLYTNLFGTFNLSLKLVPNVFTIVQKIETLDLIIPEHLSKQKTNIYILCIKPIYVQRFQFPFSSLSPKIMIDISEHFRSLKMATTPFIPAETYSASRLKSLITEPYLEFLELFYNGKPRPKTSEEFIEIIVKCINNLQTSVLAI